MFGCSVPGFVTLLMLKVKDAVDEADATSPRATNVLLLRVQLAPLHDREARVGPTSELVHTVGNLMFM